MGKAPIEETLERVDEYKINTEDETASKVYEAPLLKNEDIPVWLHPEWSKSQDPVI